jgi:hypothetical protein
VKPLFPLGQVVATPACFIKGTSCAQGSCKKSILLVRLALFYVMVHGFGPNLAVFGLKLDPSFSSRLGRRQAGATVGYDQFPFEGILPPAIIANCAYSRYRLPLLGYTSKGAECERLTERRTAMTRRRRRFLLVLGAALAIPVVLLAFLWVHSWLTYTPSKILDFHPTDLQAKTEKEFFYSIGDELKYSNEINPEASTLLRGQIRNFLVSPDSKRIAVVANGLLTVVSPEGPVIRRVAAVGSIYRDPKPIGQQFFRDDDFQWSRDSDELYLIKDEYYNSKGSQLFPAKGSFGDMTFRRGACNRS